MSNQDSESIIDFKEVLIRIWKDKIILVLVIFISGFIGFTSILVSVLTGERTNFILRACGGILASIVWKPKFIMFSLLVLIETMAVVIVLFSRPDLSNSFVKH